MRPPASVAVAVVVVVREEAPEAGSVRREGRQGRRTGGGGRALSDGVAGRLAGQAGQHTRANGSAHHRKTLHHTSSASHMRDRLHTTQQKLLDAHAHMYANSPCPATKQAIKPLHAGDCRPSHRQPRGTAHRRCSRTRPALHAAGPTPEPAGPRWWPRAPRQPQSPVVWRHPRSSGWWVQHAWWRPPGLRPCPAASVVTQIVV